MLRPVNAPAMVDARILSDWVGCRSSLGWRVLPRVAFHQFRRPSELRMEVRAVQNVLPSAKHCMPEAIANRTGVCVRSVP